MMNFGVKVLVLIALLVCTNQCYCKLHNCSIAVTAGEMKYACNDDLSNGIFKNETLDGIHIKGLLSRLSETNYNDSVDVTLTLRGKLYDILHPLNSTSPSPSGVKGYAIIYFIIIVPLILGLIICPLSHHLKKRSSANINIHTRTPSPSYFSRIPLSSFN